MIPDASNALPKARTPTHPGGDSHDLLLKLQNLEKGSDLWNGSGFAMNRDTNESNGNSIRKRNVAKCMHWIWDRTNATSERRPTRWYRKNYFCFRGAGLLDFFAGWVALAMCHIGAHLFHLHPAGDWPGFICVVKESMNALRSGSGKKKQNSRDRGGMAKI